MPGKKKEEGDSSVFLRSAYVCSVSIWTELGKLKNSSELAKKVKFFLAYSPMAYYTLHECSRTLPLYSFAEEERIRKTVAVQSDHTLTLCVEM